MTKQRLTLAWIVVVVAAPLVGTQCAAAEFADLAKLLPTDANGVMLVNAAAMYSSPLGQREGWQQKYADASEATPMMLPPSAERCVLAAELDLKSLRPAWQAAVIQLTIDPSPADIARQRGGRNDVLAGREVTWLGDRTCILKFAPQLFGVITPVNRQAAARWAEAAKAGSAGQLSPYLQEAIGYGDAAGTDVVLAVDLANTFSEASLRAAAAQAEALAGVSPDAAAAILSSVQGVKFGVKVTDRLVGRVQLDFAADAAPLASVAKPLLLKVVAKAGATLPEFANWTAETGPKSLALQGELTPDGMRRLLSLLALDAAALESPTTDVATTTTESADQAKAKMGAASVRYFRGVGKYVEDIDRLQRAASLDQAVMWIENYARKVDALPTRNVDPDLIQYGKYVADTFRAIVDEATGVADQVAQAGGPVVKDYRIGYLPTARTVNYGGDFQRMYAPYGYAEVDAQATQQAYQRTQDQVDQAVEKARQSLSQLVKDHETVRQKLSAKYGLKF
jgi:hypothetical protein